MVAVLRTLATLALAATAAAKVTQRKLGVTRFDWQQRQEDSTAGGSLLARDGDATAQQQYQPYNFSMPIDHFQNSSRYEPHSSGRFNVQYYFDASNYKPGGPVILLATGEDSAVDRVPYLRQGIIQQLAKATNGIGVILEHRYYGQSFPVPDLSTNNMRFLSTEQALADAAYFAQHVQFPGVKYNVTAANAPWFAYGGSYAGAFVAFLRTLYPGVFWGSISSSGVTAAVVDYWQYYSAIIDFGPQQCIKTIQQLTGAIDGVFTNPANQGRYNATVKKAFGLGGVSSNADFTGVLSGPTGGWQARNWDPSQSDSTFFDWCDALTSSKVNYPSVSNMTSTAQTLLKAGGYGKSLSNLTTPLLNWMGYVRSTSASQCADTGPGSQDGCFALNLPSNWDGTSLSDWPARSWTYQVCTQWGYFITGTGVPRGQLGLVSRLQDLGYLSKQCELAFGFKSLPNPSQINSWGCFDIAYPRLFFVGGEADPWRDATPLAESRWPKGRSGLGTTLGGSGGGGKTKQSGFLIHTDDYGAVHHWDENGVPQSAYNATFPPPQIQQVQRDEALLVKSWVADWAACKKGGKAGRGRSC